MNTINNAYINALLADAAYIDLTKGISNADLGKALNEPLTKSQAQFIATNFEVIASENKSDRCVTHGELAGYVPNWAIVFELLESLSLCASFFWFKRLFCVIFFNSPAVYFVYDRHHAICCTC